MYENPNYTEEITIMYELLAEKYICLDGLISYITNRENCTINAAIRYLFTKE
jgi:hypothetical protein